MKLLFIRRKLKMQNHFGFYKSGFRSYAYEDIWYGLELPFLDIRIIINKKKKGRVFSSTEIEFDGNANAKVGVTAHCSCGKTFCDDVIAGL